MRALQSDPPGQRRPDRGFTLIELLAVILIIGILAAVAITAYVGQQEKAYLSTVKVDLRNLATAQRTYFVDHETYGTAHQLATEIDFRTSAGGAASVIWSSSAGFCVAATNVHAAADASSALAAIGFGHETIYFDSTVGTTSTTPCTVPPGASGMDGGYWDESGAH